LKVVLDGKEAFQYLSYEGKKTLTDNVKVPANMLFPEPE
jgi:hypothetical protein